MKHFNSNVLQTYDADDDELDRIELSEAYYHFHLSRNFQVLYQLNITDPWPWIPEYLGPIAASRMAGKMQRKAVQLGSFFFLLKNCYFFVPLRVAQIPFLQQLLARSVDHQLDGLLRPQKFVLPP